MLSRDYDPNLVSLDLGWLQRVGTAFAVASCTYDIQKLAEKQEKIRLQQLEILNILEASGRDEDLRHETLVLISVRHYTEDLQCKERIVEHQLVAVQGHKWVPRPSDALSDEDVLRNVGFTPSLTQEEFEGGWQRAEAGY